MNRKLRKTLIVIEFLCVVHGTEHVLMDYENSESFQTNSVGKVEFYNAFGRQPWQI